MISKPASEIEADERRESSTGKLPDEIAINEIVISPEAVMKTVDIKKDTLKDTSKISLQATKPEMTEKKGKRQYVMTYFYDENYDLFEEMFDEIKRYVRQTTGIKLKETNVAEIAIMLVVEDFKKDREKILARFVEKSKSRE